MRAADIPTAEVLARVAFWEDPARNWHIGASVRMIDGWNRDTDFSAYVPRWPEKVLRAKLSSLTRKGYIDGCNCGCRGDFVLTAKGRVRLAELTEGM
jgi:hypothetical protein